MTLMTPASAPPFEPVDRPEVAPGPLDARSHAHEGQLAMAQVLSLLREIRRELQNLARSIEDVRSKGQLRDASTRANEAILAFAEADAIFRKNAREVGERFDSIKKVLGDHTEIRDWAGDTVTGIEDDWDRFEGKWGSPAPAPEPGEAAARQLFADSVLLRVAAAAAEIPEMIRDLGLLTIPHRVNQYLKNLRVGQALDFHTAFMDELPSKDDRDKLLAYMKSQAAAIDGVVEVATGRIYKAATRNGLRRGASYVLLAGLIVAGGVLAFLLGEVGRWLALADWPLDGRNRDLLSAYVFVVLGAGAHLLVDAVKQSRAKEGGLVALDEGLIWIHVKEVPIAIAIFTLWIGLLGLAFSAGAERIQWLTAFAAGYGIDSLVDVFLRRFETRVSKATEPLREAGAGATP